MTARIDFPMAVAVLRVWKNDSIARMGSQLRGASRYACLVWSGVMSEFVKRCDVGGRGIRRASSEKTMTLSAIC